WYRLAQLAPSRISVFEVRAGEGCGRHRRLSVPIMQILPKLPLNERKRLIAPVESWKMLFLRRRTNRPGRSHRAIELRLRVMRRVPHPNARIVRQKLLQSEFAEEA